MILHDVFFLETYSSGIFCHKLTNCHGHGYPVLFISISALARAIASSSLGTTPIPAMIGDGYHPKPKPQNMGSYSSFEPYPTEQQEHKLEKCRRAKQTFNSSKTPGISFLLDVELLPRGLQVRKGVKSPTSIHQLIHMS